MLYCVYVCVPHLEVRLYKYAGELSCSVGALCEGVEVSEDLLEELHIVLPHWRQTWLLQAFLLLLTPPHTHTLIHTFILSSLEYCNSLYNCLSQAPINRLQWVQNTAARLTLTSCSPTLPLYPSTGFI